MALPQATLVIFVYLLGTASAIKILSGSTRTVAAVAFVLTAATVPFALGHVLVPIAVAAAALSYHALAHAATRRRNHPPHRTDDPLGTGGAAAGRSSTEVVTITTHDAIHDLVHKSCSGGSDSSTDPPTTACCPCVVALGTPHAR